MHTRIFTLHLDENFDWTQEHSQPAPCFTGNVSEATPGFFFGNPQLKDASCRTEEYISPGGKTEL
jgi:hypothetical protein